VNNALKCWPEPDLGILEVRFRPRHFTLSKAMYWAAAQLGAKFARRRHEYDLAATWQAAAGEMHADICAHGVDDRGVFTQHYGAKALGASLLMLPVIGFLPPDDPRIRAIVLAIADELTDEGLVLRYRVEETDDGLSRAEGSFTLCSFQLVSALTLIGEHGSSSSTMRETPGAGRRTGPVRRTDRFGDRPSPRQLSTGLHTSRLDGRRPRHHQVRAVKVTRGEFGQLFAWKCFVRNNMLRGSPIDRLAEIAGNTGHDGCSCRYRHLHGSSVGACRANNPHGGSDVSPIDVTTTRARSGGCHDRADGRHRRRRGRDERGCAG
jgi:glycosyl hydrolase family 15